jgi:hypothetical protein
VKNIARTIGAICVLAAFLTAGCDPAPSTKASPGSAQMQQQQQDMMNKMKGGGGGSGAPSAPPSGMMPGAPK